MLCCLTSTEYLAFQQCINNVPMVFDLLEVITSQACGHFSLIEEVLPLSKYVSTSIILREMY